MQNTRLNNLVNVATNQLARWLANPWRRFSAIAMSLLFGIFLGTAVPTTSGQAADWDIIAAGLLAVFTEISSRIYYTIRPRGASRPFLIDMLNALKIGLTYSLFVEAFKLGS
jgi:Protein of unknown function (DUF565)